LLAAIAEAVDDGPRPGKSPPGRRCGEACRGGTISRGRSGGPGAGQLQRAVPDLGEGAFLVPPTPSPRRQM